MKNNMKLIVFATIIGISMSLPSEYHYYSDKDYAYYEPAVLFTPQIHAQGASGPDGRIHGGYQVGGQVPIGGGSVGGSVSGTFGHGSDLPRGYQVGGQIPVGGGHIGIGVGGNFGHRPNSIGITGSWPFG